MNGPSTPSPARNVPTSPSNPIFDADVAGDGLRHFAYQAEQRFYNGVTLDDIHGPTASAKNGIGAWAAQGIVGRGVLCDWLAWRRATKPDLALHARDAFRTGGIPLSELLSTLEWQGTRLKFGDVLFVRSGWMNAYNQMSREEIEALRDGAPAAGFRGVEQSEEVLRWVWENFAAVAGDQPAFESWREWMRFPSVDID